MKKQTMIAVFLLMAHVICADQVIDPISLEQVQQVLQKPAVSHPRLFLTDRQLPEVMKRISGSDNLAVLHKTILQQADASLERETLQRKLTGRRLLSVSVAAVKRLMMLGWAYRSTGNERYLKRAEKEMLALAAFSDWNPKHFLDVAEMTTAMAVGYDWFYDGLSQPSRETIRRAIVEKGLRPSLYENQEPGWWLKTANNWNQVCHGGLTCGALAVMEDEPTLAATIIHRSVNKIQIAMNEYEPDGAYPEGPGYWAYGTTYNVLFLAALDSALGTDFELSQKKGFSKGGDYYLHVIGPTGLFFNYPDSGSRPNMMPAVYWLAKKYNKPSLPWHQHKIWENKRLHNPSDLVRDRIAVLALLWASEGPVRPTALSWMGLGKNPVAMFRTSWDDNAVYLGIKGGTPSSNHAHMDIGSFVIDADGVRWALDLGPENYNKIETRGVGLWDSKQAGDRWKLFRYNNYSHNTLTVNDQLQRVDGFAPLIRYSSAHAFPHAVVDMTEVYQGQLAKALRGASVLPTGHIVIQDEFCAADKPADVRWAMATPAEVEILSNKKAVLTQKDKALQVEVLTDADIKLTTFSTQPRADYDAENKGTRMVGFHVKLASGQAQTTRVVMVSAANEKPAAMKMKNVEAWSKPLK